MKNLEARRSWPAGPTTSPAPGDVGAHSRWPVRDRIGAPTRELAQRSSGTVEVLLLWHPGTDRVELAVHDLTTDVSFHLDVAPGDALDAFHHPYAYVSRRQPRSRGIGEEQCTPSSS